jgi:RNA polymerase sigma-70 factor, ECF subfamily
MDNEEFLRVTLPALDLVYNLARRVVPREMDAEDLVQETYLAALGAWRDRRRPRRVEPWLATICLNLARSGYRHRARRPQEVPWEDLAPVASEADPADQVVAALDRRAVHDAMWALSDGQRIAVALVDLCGFSVADAARVMRCPKGTVLSRLHRGRKALARLLKEEAEERKP